MTHTEIAQMFMTLFCLGVFGIIMGFVYHIATNDRPTWQKAAAIIIGLSIATPIPSLGLLLTWSY